MARLKIFFSVLLFFLLNFFTLDKGSSYKSESVLILGEKQKHIFLKATSLTETDDGNIYVVDHYAYRIKMFNNKGTLLKEAGSRGKGKGNFLNMPYLITSYKNNLAIAEFTSSRVQLFSTNMDYLKSFSVDGIILDISFDHDGNLWLGIMDPEGKTYLSVYDLRGQRIKKISLKNNLGKEFEFGSIFVLTVAKTGLVFIAHTDLNKIEVWNTGGEFVKDFSIGDLPANPEKKVVNYSLFSKKYVPIKKIFQDIAVDENGLVYILGGHYSSNPFQDIYVVDHNGAIKRKLTLPEKVSTIYLTHRNEFLIIDKMGFSVKLYRFK
jgi:hypothetical protein